MATWKDGKLYAHVTTEGKEHVNVREIIDGDMVSVSTRSWFGLVYSSPEPQAHKMSL